MWVTKLMEGSVGDSIELRWPPVIDYIHALFRLTSGKLRISIVIFQKSILETSNSVIFFRFGDKVKDQII